jgi:hypothetical protein
VAPVDPIPPVPPVAPALPEVPEEPDVPELAALTLVFTAPSASITRQFVLLLVAIPVNLIVPETSKV